MYFIYTYCRGDRAVQPGIFVDSIIAVKGVKVSDFGGRSLGNYICIHLYINNVNKLYLYYYK